MKDHYTAPLLSWANYVFWHTRFRIHRYVAAPIHKVIESLHKTVTPLKWKLKDDLSCIPRRYSLVLPGHVCVSGRVKGFRYENWLFRKWLPHVTPPPGIRPDTQFSPQYTVSEVTPTGDSSSRNQTRHTASSHPNTLFRKGLPQVTPPAGIRPDTQLSPQYTV